MADGVQIVVSPDVYLVKIQKLQDEIANKDLKIHDLEVQLEYERSLREASSVMEIGPQKTTHKKREVTPYTNTYSDFKSDGKRKAHAADPIRSYDDFKLIQNYFWSKGNVRDWMMWTIGVSLGLRVSDLLSLKFKNVLLEDKTTIRPRIEIYEQKTGKLNNLLITESVRQALTAYLESIRYRFDLEDFL